MQELFIEDFISNNDQANSIITDFSKNKLIIKDDTGLGATSAVLNIKNQNVVIISPLVGMIQCKENNKQNNQKFIYKDSDDKWQHIEQLLENEEQFILNTTPEQIIELRKYSMGLFDQIMETPFFVDEFQIYGEADYRKSLPEFYYILFSEHKACSTLSTATPTFDNLDIPSHFLATMNVYNIKQSNPRNKSITISEKNNYWNFVKEHCAAGHKVILHTNDKNIIKNLINPELFPNYKVQYLTGENLGIKLAPYRPQTCEEKNYIDESTINPAAKVIILSTKYQIGFDVAYDCAVGIICDQNSRVDNKTVNEIIQCYGRCRQNVIEAKLFYSCSKAPDYNIEQEATKIRDINYNEECLPKIQEGISKINQKLTFPQENIIRSLEEKGFEVNVEQNISDAIHDSTNFKQKLQNLVEQDLSITEKQFMKVYSRIKGDDKEYQGYNTRNLLLWTAAYIIKVTNSPYLLDMLNLADLRYERILLYLKTFIDANEYNSPDSMTPMDKITNYRVSEEKNKKAIDEGAKCDKYEELSMEFFGNFEKAKQIINTLYVIDLVEKEKTFGADLKYIKGLDMASEIIKTSFISGLSDMLCIDNIEEIIKNKDIRGLQMIDNSIINKKLKHNDLFRNTNQNIFTKLRQMGYEEDEIKLIKKKSLEIMRNYLKNDAGVMALINRNNHSLNQVLARHKHYLLYMLSMLVANHTHGFLTTDIDNREFTPVTKVNSWLRKYTPYKMIHADMSSAFPSILDHLFETNIKNDVYNNISAHFKIDRDEAKIKFNITLNDPNITKSSAINIFRIAGYTADVAQKIYKKTSKAKGEFYRFMTPIEEKVVNKFIDINDINYDKYHRIHDAVLFYDVLESVIINEFDEFRFTIETLIPPQE